MITKAYLSPKEYVCKKTRFFGVVFVKALFIASFLQIMLMVKHVKIFVDKKSHG